MGPMVVAPWNGNPEMFVNLGLPGAAIPSTYYPTRSFTPPGSTQAVTYQPDYLFVVNRQDDNGNGLVDEGWNGIDDNLDQRPLDDLTQWEPETWLGSIGNTLLTITINPLPPPPVIFGRIQNQSYTIIRRPVPSPNSREICASPSNVVIDLTSVLLENQERSRFPVGTIDPYTGHVDIVLTPGAATSCRRRSIPRRRAWGSPGRSIISGWRSAAICLPSRPATVSRPVTRLHWSKITHFIFRCPLGPTIRLWVVIPYDLLAAQ